MTVTRRSLGNNACRRLKCTSRSRRTRSPIRFEDEVPKGADLGQYAVEDWLALAIFWVMALCVFLQFFTRYVLNDSYAWTEEIATYCLIGVVFIGSAMCVRLSRHIQVDLLFRYLPHCRRARCRP